MKWIAAIVMFYMLAALCWWSILLLKQNELIYAFNTGAIQPMAAQEAILSYHKQKKMILGEGMVFGLSLLAGIYLLYRFFRNQLIATKSQNNFILAFSHELKSPLTSINLSLDTLKKRALSQDKVGEVCDIALDESKRLESLINSILMVAKIDDFIIKPEFVNLIDLIQDTISIVNPKLFANQNITFLSEEKTLVTQVDILAFKSIIINLLENAIKYGDTKPIEIEIVDKGYIQINVKDQGKGISNEEKSKIFQRFYRIGNENTRSATGTGLGLYIVKRLVEMHKGQITLQDNLPKGSIFSVTLPKINAI
jgi:signal transduction histidine kinase